MPDPTAKTLRTVSGAYFGFLSIPSVLVLLTLATIPADPLGGGIGTIAAAALVAFLYAWLRAFSISVNDGWLEGHSLLREWRVRIDDITYVGIVHVPLSERGVARGPRELIVTGVQENGMPFNLSLNVSVFDLRELRQLVGELAQ